MGHEWGAGSVVRFWRVREGVACLARAGRHVPAPSQPALYLPCVGPDPNLCICS